MAESYELGQIIYILSNKSQTVVPAIVSEEFLHKKLNGNVVTYKVAIGPTNRQKIVDLDKIDGEVFKSLEDIRVTLTNKLTEYVTELVTTTETRVREWYGNPNQQTQTAPSASPEGKIDPLTFLENGPVSQNVNSTRQQVTPVAAMSQNSFSSVRDHLKAMADPGPQMDDEVEDGVITMPDGTKIKAKFHLNEQ